MTTYLGKSCSFGLPRVPFVNCRQFMYLVISLLVLRAGCGIWLYQFLIISYLFNLYLWRINIDRRKEVDLWEISQCSNLNNFLLILLALTAYGLGDQANDINEPPHDKTNKWHVRPAKPQISLGIRQRS